MGFDKEKVTKQLIDVVGAAYVKPDEPMKNHTSFRIGGCADILVVPGTTKELQQVYQVCLDSGIPYFIIGNGTNLIVRDKGIRGVVIKIFDRLNRYHVDGENIEAEAGLLLSRVSRIALEQGLTGLEFAEGIPGTLGGGVTMNAGAYTGEMANVVEKTEYMDKNGEVKVLSGENQQFGYRSSFIQRNGGIILKAYLKLKKGNHPEIKAQMDDFSARRRCKQPLEMPSAGSVFRRPAGFYAGKLIEESGLRGYRIGGAEVSAKHCGFIVNIGNATAKDVLDLIQYVQAAVKSKSGVNLETEVKVVGEE